MSSQPTSHRRNLTEDRRRLRALHHNPRPRDKITYRSHTIKRERHDKSQSGCYRILKNSQFIDAIEPSDFHNEDDWVRYIDLVIQHGREHAKDWLRNELGWSWDHIPQTKPTPTNQEHEETPQTTQEPATPDNEADDTQFVISKHAISSKRRHEPATTDDGELQPACRTANQRDNSWTLKDEQHTVFYDDCQRCFGDESE